MSPNQFMHKTHCLDGLKRPSKTINTNIVNSDVVKVVAYPGQ